VEVRRDGSYWVARGRGRVRGRRVRERRGWRGVGGGRRVGEEPAGRREGTRGARERGGGEGGGVCHGGEWVGEPGMG